MPCFNFVRLVKCVLRVLRFAASSGEFEKAYCSMSSEQQSEVMRLIAGLLMRPKQSLYINALSCGIICTRNL